jgi:fused signal recognition particle receptor
MFDKLRNAFSSVAKNLSEKELKESDIDDVLFQLEIALMESDVATEVIDSIKSDLKKKLIGTSVDKKEIEEFVKNNLIQNISNLFDIAGSTDIFAKISSKKNSSEPCIILFVGINGTGKTTSLAKLAHLIKENKFSVVIAAADTFRAGAIEQLKEHANRLSIKIIAQNYGADPAAVARDAVLYAKSHKIDCVLIDTAGRMQTSKNLMEQIEKITKVVNPDLKIFVGDSLAGNDTVNQAREFFEHTKFDGAILTKSDADARGGAALSVVTVTAKPVLYVGVGQEYADLRPFDKNLFLETVFGQGLPQTVPKTQSEIKPEPKPEIKPEPKPEIKPERKNSDPFDGINDKDISLYADLYDVPPPENDDEAFVLGKRIRKWIEDGRPKPGQKPKTEEISAEESMEPGVDKENKVKEEDKQAKPKKGLFGWMKK